MGAMILNQDTLLVRPVTKADVGHIRRLLETAWRIHLRPTWQSLRPKLVTMPGVVVEDRVGVRGFMVFEPQSFDKAIIIAAGLRDTWSVRPYLALILPKIEALVRENSRSGLTYIGQDSWLMEGLLAQGFEAREWIITFERFGSHPPPETTQPARLRGAHRTDLGAIRLLDAMAFDHLWHKSAGHFNEALATAGSFVVAEMDGQLVGFEWCEFYQKRGHLTRLAIHPDYQGRGIGAQLLRQSILDALAKEINLITLNTQETNQRSQALYHRFGFTPTQQRIPLLWKKMDSPG
jgi:ribosomal-protein-alanine N-acetyltransferase